MGAAGAGTRLRAAAALAATGIGLAVAGSIHAPTAGAAETASTNAERAAAPAAGPGDAPAEGATAARAPAAAVAQAGEAAPGTAAAVAAPHAPALADTPVVVYNRRIAVLRTPLFGASAEERARRAAVNVAQALALGGPGRVEVEHGPLGAVIRVDGAFAFAIRPGDVDVERGDTPETVARAAAVRLEDAIAASRESRDARQLLAGAARIAGATVLALLLLVAVRRATAAAGGALLRLAGSGAQRLRVGGTEVLSRQRLVAATRRLVGAIRWLLVAVVAYQWLGFVLASVPYTRPWGEQLNRSLVELLAQLSHGTVHALPDLIVAATIFWLAWVVDRVLGAFLHRAARTPGTLAWLDRDTLGPSARLKTVAVWLFALAMAYPYLPGSGTEAFKGLSVLVGLMISLGGSSLVGQAASGMVLMYTRTLRVGEYVSIDGNEGTIVEIGTFATRIRTGRGEELTLPNALVMATVTRNYSRTSRGRGFVLDTEVTIGYDTPWRQVQAMLVEAARRTAGIVDDPAPRVYQTALSDFYPTYRLVCQAAPAEPQPRAEVLSVLHGHIQDVFNENGVQIMSPHYFGDPDAPKVVPPSRWAPALAPDADARAAAAGRGAPPARSAPEA